MQILTLITALPGAVAQGLIWGIMAIGVYITFRILDIADLTVDGTMCTEKPDLIIGTSMGGMYTELLKGFDRILVNPAFEMGDTMPFVKNKPSAAPWLFLVEAQKNRRTGLRIEPDVLITAGAAMYGEVK